MELSKNNLIIEKGICVRIRSAKIDQDKNKIDSAGQIFPNPSKYW